MAGAVGVALGEGLTVGDGVLEPVGELEGVSVGVSEAVGELEGVSVGVLEAVGELEGVSDAVGLVEGVAVGVFEGVALGVGLGVPLRIAKRSLIAPVLVRKIASIRSLLKSRTIEPSWLRLTYMAGWFSVPPLIWPELPATA